MRGDDLREFADVNQGVRLLASVQISQKPDSLPTAKQRCYLVAKPRVIELPLEGRLDDGLHLGPIDQKASSDCVVRRHRCCPGCDTSSR